MLKIEDKLQLIKGLPFLSEEIRLLKEEKKRFKDFVITNNKDIVDYDEANMFFDTLIRDKQMEYQRILIDKLGVKEYIKYSIRTKIEEL